MTETGSTEADTVIRARAGDTAAFETLVRQHYRGVVLEAASYLGSGNDVEDLAQDAFIQAFLKLGMLQPPYRFGAWIRQIARNMARNRSRRSPRHVPMADTHDMASAGPDTVTVEIIHVRRLEHVITALSRLSSPLRETARLSYLQQFSHQQIAHRLNIPMGTVKRRLWDSRARIRKEVLTMSRTGRNDELLTRVPEILIRELPGTSMTVTALGPGLYFGSKLAPEHAETCRFYDYPGGVLTLTVHTRVLRQVTVMGHRCWEVMVEHRDCEPESPNLLDYFEETGSGFHWRMRVSADPVYPQTHFPDETEIFPRCYSEGDHGDYTARVVELEIGGIRHGRCLAVFWAWEEGTPAESFFSEEGRQVLHRRYAGPDAPPSSNYDYETLAGGHILRFRGTEYRLWYDTVLDPR